MEISDYKDLIRQVQCEVNPGLGFTDEDLDQVKACVEAVIPIVPDDEPQEPVIDNTSCIPNAIADLTKMMQDQQANFQTGVQQGILKAKVQELRDNLDVVKAYYQARLDFFDMIAGLLTENTSQSVSLAKQNVLNTPALPSIDTEVRDLIKSQTMVISNQVVTAFSNTITTVPRRTASFSLRLVNLDGVPMKLPDPQGVMQSFTVKIKDNDFLTAKVFDPLVSFSCFNAPQYDPNSSSNPPKEEGDYDTIPGLLYNGTPNVDYAGLYRKLTRPLTYLFTLEERGLTVDPNLIDPKLKELKDVPTSINENEVTYYIANQQTYESFYGSLEKEYPKRETEERTVVYPGVTKPGLDVVRDTARREAADVFRATMNPAGNFQFSITDPTLAVPHVYYRDSNDEIAKLMADCDAVLKDLDSKIKENMMDESTVRKKVAALPCFTESMNAIPETDPGCEATTMEKLGTDPLYLRTLGEVNSGLPSLSSQCYWREFAKELNKICLLPFPDLSGPPPSNMVFRYWPINCVIPAGPALVLLTVPPVWKPLFVLPTPLGTLVCFLTMPIAPIGIPLPSIYLFYLAPDGTKYLALAVNFPLLYAGTKNLIFGFELDTSSTSRNPLGLSPTNPYKGYPIKGAYQVPLKTVSTTSKAARLAKLASDVVTGKLPTVTNLNGGELPFSMTPEDYAKAFPSESEMMDKILSASPKNEFLRDLDELKTNMNKQLDKLGEMQTTAINGLRQKVRDTRTAAVEEASKATDLATKRVWRNAARNINPLTIDEKINATVSDFLTYIDNIKFGTIKFPKDATKNNPGLPEAVTSIFDLIEMASRGDLKIDEGAKSLNYQIKKALGKVNAAALSTKSEFDMEVKEDVDAIKKLLNDMMGETIKYIKGDSVSFDVSGAKDDEEAKQIVAANRAIQETARDALAFTAAFLANPPQITIFDLTKKCCEVHAQPLFSGIPTEVSIVFAVFATLMQAMIDGLTPDAILGFAGVSGKKIAVSFVTSMFDSIVSAIPNVSLPNPANLSVMLQAIMIPVLTIISIPKSINPLQIPMIPIVIPLDPILKPLIKSIIAALIAAIFGLLEQANQAVISNGGTLSGLEGTTQVVAVTDADKYVLTKIFSQSCGHDTTVNVIVTETVNGEEIITGTAGTQPQFEVTVSVPGGPTVLLPTIPLIALDLMNHFELITGSDIIELVRKLMNTIFDSIVDPLKQVVSVISDLAMSFNTFSYNIIEAAIPLISIIKLVKMAIDAQIPPSIKLNVMTQDILNLLQLSIIPALEAVEPVLKEVAWIGAIALCSLASPVTNYLPVAGARLLHPIMNMDDLPPWERLTHKNPLFAIFLDEIAWRGSLYSTGSLIFQTKTPAVYPYSPTFPIVHVSPHLT